MKTYYDQQSSRGYALHIEELKKYANLVLGVLGEHPDGLDAAGRVRILHRTLTDHPYAYPLALELSLYMPPQTAISWINGLVSAYYGKHYPYIMRETAAFLIWRMPLEQALEAAVAYVRSDACPLPSVDGFLEEYFPRMAAYVQHQRTVMRPPRFTGYGAWWRRRKQACYAWVQRAFFLQKKPAGDQGTCRLKPGLLRLYRRSETPGEHGSPRSWRKDFLAASLLRIILPRVSEITNPLCCKRWMELPVQHEARLRPRTAAARLRILHSTVICGERYVEQFERFNLPTLLASGNIPALSEEADVCCVFYTTVEDAERLRHCPGYQKLRDYADIRFVFLDRVNNDVPYQLAGELYSHKYISIMVAHNHFRWLAAAEDRYAIFNFPDIILQQDFYSRLLQLVLEGKKNIYFSPGPSVVQEWISKEIASWTQDGVMEINHRDLNALIKKCIHPYESIFYQGADQRMYSGGTSMFRAGGEGEIVHNTCLPVMMCKPEMTCLCLEATFDFSITLTPLDTYEAIHFFGDNTEVCIASLEPFEGFDNAMRFGSYDCRETTKNMLDIMRLFNRLFYTASCRYYYTDTPTEQIWHEAREEGKTFIQSVLRQGRDEPVIPPLDYFFEPDVFLPKTAGTTGSEACIATTCCVMGDSQQ